MQTGTRGGWWVLGQVALMVLVFASASVGQSWPERFRLAAHVTAAVLITAGMLLLVVGALQLGFASSLSPFPTPTARGQLLSSGVYRLARHPMYGGGMLFAVGWSILFASAAGLCLTIMLGMFLVLKAGREEAWLFERYPDYEAYRQRTRWKFLPFVY